MDDGLYVLFNDNNDYYVAYCMFDTINETGWTVLMQRSHEDKELSFDMSWRQFKEGFGNLGSAGSFWLGNEHMSQLTLNSDMMLRVELVDSTGTFVYAEVSWLTIFNGQSEARYKQVDG